MLLQHTVENWCCRPHKHIVISAFTVLYFWVLCFLCFFVFFFWPQPQTSPRLPFLYFNNDYAKRAVLMSQHGSHYHISHTLFSGFSHARRGKEAEKVAHILVVLFSLCAVITSKGKFSSFGRSPTKRITAHNRWSTHTHTHTHTHNRHQNAKEPASWIDVCTRWRTDPEHADKKTLPWELPPPLLILLAGIIVLLLLSSRLCPGPRWKDIIKREKLCLLQKRRGRVWGRGQDEGRRKISHNKASSGLQNHLE